MLYSETTVNMAVEHPHPSLPLLSIIQRRRNTVKNEQPGFSSEFLQEAQHQVPERGPQWLTVTDDMRPVLLQLNERVLRLQVQDVPICRFLHFNFCDPVLQMST